MSFLTILTLEYSVPPEINTKSKKADTLSILTYFSKLYLYLKEVIRDSHYYEFML